MPNKFGAPSESQARTTIEQSLRETGAFSAILLPGKVETEKAVNLAAVFDPWSKGPGFGQMLGKTLAIVFSFGLLWPVLEFTSEFGESAELVATRPDGIERRYSAKITANGGGTLGSTNTSVPRDLHGVVTRIVINQLVADDELFALPPDNAGR